MMDYDGECKPNKFFPLPVDFRFKGFITGTEQKREHTRALACTHTVVGTCSHFHPPSSPHLCCPSRCSSSHLSHTLRSDRFMNICFERFKHFRVSIFVTIIFRELIIVSYVTLTGTCFPKRIPMSSYMCFSFLIIFTINYCHHQQDLSPSYSLPLFSRK